MKRARNIKDTVKNQILKDKTERKLFKNQLSINKTKKKKIKNNQGRALLMSLKMKMYKTPISLTWISLT